MTAKEYIESFAEKKGFWDPALKAQAYVMDLYQYGLAYDLEFRRKFYLYGHMNPSGYILTAQLVDSYIDYIVRHNPDDFRTAGMINTDIPYKL